MSVHPQEIAALKAELKETMLRRLKVNGRNNIDTFVLAQMAVSEMLADVIYAASQDLSHCANLLKVSQGYIHGVWAEREASGARKELDKIDNDKG